MPPLLELPESTHPAGASLEDKVAFLLRPESYENAPLEIEAKETHMSWVFLAGESAFKLKKPVAYPFLDFRTLDQRAFYCREEIRLNHRLAPEIYQGVIPLTLEKNGTLALNGAGTIVDWLVKMRRLPEERMLNRAIAKGSVAQAEVVSLVPLLVRFYKSVAVADLSPDEYLSVFLAEHEENERVLSRTEFNIPRRATMSMLARIRRFLENDAQLLAERALARRILEGHGDLRPQHICLVSPPVIIDCLEFNPKLRLVDPFNELAFLRLECARLGAPWIGELVLKLCSDALQGRPSERLLAFYAAFRACLRARLSLAHLLDTVPSEPEKWIPLARKYISIAEQGLAAR